MFDRDNKLLASWIAPRDGALSGIERRLGAVMLPRPTVLPVFHDGLAIGRVELRGQGAALMQFLLRGFSGMLLCLALSLAAAFYLSRRMQSGITAPLQALAKVAHAGHHDRVMGQRVPPTAIAEFNELGDDFNALLDTLEAWQKQLQHENASLTHRANHDSLTGLPNRAFFEMQLGAAMRAAAQARHCAAILFLDCDRFKDINDRLGHAAGDAVLVSVAARVRSQLRQTDLVARLGGDEFAVLIAALGQADDALQIADAILASMLEPIALPAGGEVVASLSIGIALFPHHARDAHRLLAGADAAMYRAKRQQAGSRDMARADDFEALYSGK